MSEDLKQKIGDLKTIIQDQVTGFVIDTGFIPEITITPTYQTWNPDAADYNKLRHIEVLIKISIA